MKRQTQLISCQNTSRNIPIQYQSITIFYLLCFSRMYLKASVKWRPADDFRQTLLQLEHFLGFQYKFNTFPNYPLFCNLSAQPRIHFLSQNCVTKKEIAYHDERPKVLCIKRSKPYFNTCNKKNTRVEQEREGERREHNILEHFINNNLFWTAHKILFGLPQCHRLQK